MATITLRGVPEATLESLKQKARESGLSMNRFLVQKLEEEIVGRRKRAEHHDMEHLFGTMSQDECEALCRTVDEQRDIDDELWS